MPHFVCLLLGDFCNSASGIFRIPQRNSLFVCSCSCRAYFSWWNGVCT